jgi:hypothetical protein
MTMTGPWHKERNRRYGSGPMSKPGTYSIVLTVDGNSLKQSFDVMIDPRNEAAGVSAEDIVKQVDLQLLVRNLLSESRKLENELDKKTDRSSNENNALEKLKTKKGIYMQPMLTDQISYLYSMLNSADQLPGKDAYDRFEELKTVFNELKASL